MPDTARMLALAEELMALSRNAIVMNLRFMDMAVFRLRAEPADATLATDGRYLFYGPEHVLRRYLRDPALPQRDYLHALLHCVFRHPFIDTLVDRARWDLAADIAVEALIGSLELPRFEAGREGAQRPVIERLTRRLGLLTAEKLYRYFEDNPPPEAWAELFRADDHALWHQPNRRQDLQNAKRGEDGDSQNGGGQGDPPPEAQERREEQPPQPGGQKQNDGGAPGEAAPAPENDPVRDAPSQTFSQSAPDDGGGADDSPSQTLRSEAGGDSGSTLHRLQDDSAPQNQNTGKGLDTEGGESSTPAGAQTRNDRTRHGVDSSRANGTSGDSGDARSQRGDADSGGSGSGLSDARVLEAALAPERANAPELSEEWETEDRGQLKREWQDVSERIQMDLEAQSHQRGVQAGGLQRQLEIGNRERYDYATFLRKFAVLGEHMQLNDDEFDQIFYTYGLRLYGNLPLIEPLETKEVKRIREFVIAIDTSGSTSGALVERFLTRTYEILASEESFFRKFHLRILQCDATIQESATIASREDFDRYLRGFTAKGLGGTDFRPVFRHVDELLRQGAFTHLKGLIYFTDGQGTFPERKPDYETAFVFVEPKDGDAPQVPPWAIRLVLEDGQLAETHANG